MKFNKQIYLLYVTYQNHETWNLKKRSAFLVKEVYLR